MDDQVSLKPRDTRDIDSEERRMDRNDEANEYPNSFTLNNSQAMYRTSKSMRQDHKVCNMESGLAKTLADKLVSPQMIDDEVSEVMDRT